MPEGLMAADQARSSVKATELFPPFPEVTSGNGGRGDRLAGLFDSDSNSDPDEELSTAPSSPVGTGGGGGGAGGGSPVTSPPYWLQTHGHGGRRGVGHGRTVSNVSTESVLPITLQDNEEEDDDSNEQRLGSSGSGAYGRDRNKACWAKSVEIRDYVIVNGSATNIGAFVVWNIRVETLTGSYMNIRKRYSEFDELRRQLVFTFPNFEAAVPALPRKSLFSKFSPVFLEKRRSGLQYFLNCILLNPEFSGSPILKDFLFS